MSKKILSINFVKDVDECPDLSDLGEYSNEPAEHCIDRKECGDWRQREYRYFNLGCGDPEYLEQDYQRMKNYNQNNWCMLHCYMQANIVIGDTLQTIRSGGLGGIESDSDDSYFAEIQEEEFQELKSILLELGFTEAEIDQHEVVCK